jgi:heme exporter protein A
MEYHSLNDILTIRDLTCVRGDRVVFDDLNFTLTSGHALILKGDNGSGKSSLLKILSGSLEALGGELAFGDSKFNHLRDFEWISEHIAYLGHKNALKSEMTVGENISFWQSISVSGEATDSSDLLNSSDLLALLDEMGIGYLKNILGSKLSSGQARRAAMVRLLALGRKIWLLDEPTVGLDHEGITLLNRVMEKHLNSGGMIIMATHVNVGLEVESYDFLSLNDFKASEDHLFGKNHLVGDEW